MYVISSFKWGAWNEGWCREAPLEGAMRGRFLHVSVWTRRCWPYSLAHPVSWPQTALKVKFNSEPGLGSSRNSIIPTLGPKVSEEPGLE